MNTPYTQHAQQESMSKDARTENLARTMRSRPYPFVITLILLGYTCGVIGCDQELEMGMMTDEPPSGANQADFVNQNAVGALISGAGTFTGCSVAFITSKTVLTAARCVANNPNDLYQITTESPFTNTSLRLPVSKVTVHPLWNTAEEGRAQEHIAAIRQGQQGYYRSAASYDLAILELANPKGDDSLFEPFQGATEVPQVDTLYFAQLNISPERSGGSLVIQEHTTTTLTAMQSSTLTSTRGGGVAIVKLGGGGDALIGIASGGVPNQQGVIFTRVSAHFNFITDVLTGTYSLSNDLARYRVTVQGSGPETGGSDLGGIGDQFDCTRVSDQYCDLYCSTGEDIDCNPTVSERSGSPFGSTCLEGGDCISHLCLGVTETRYICSAHCDPARPNDCPANFECVMSNGGASVCAPRVDPLPGGGGGGGVELRLFGADCTQDAQCTTMACITHNGQKWCSQRCAQTEDCPLSYVCGPVAEGRACVPPPQE